MQYLTSWEGFATLRGILVDKKRENAIKYYIIVWKQPFRTGSKVAFVFLTTNFYNTIVNVPTKTIWQHFKKDQLLMVTFTTRWLVIILPTLFNKETLPIDNYPT